MFAIENLSHRSAAEVPLGHLVLCGGHFGEGPQLALRIEAPGDHDMDRDGLLFLRSRTPWGSIAPVVLSRAGEQECLDLGEPKFAVNDETIGTAISHTHYDAQPGTLAIRGTELLILATYGNRHMVGWWQVSNGKQMALEKAILVQKWCVGLRDVESRFVSQLRYPEDFIRPENAS